MLHDAISQPAWDECTIDMERAAYLTEWLSDAGWRPPPEPQDSGLPPLEPLQQQPARFKLRVTETPPPLPIAEPQENEAARLRKIIALALAASDYGSIREVLWRGFDNGPPPEPQAGEVAERAREINKRIHIDCQAPRCSCSDGVCAVSETYIRDALLAEHARAEERDLYKASAMHHAERAEAAERRLYVVASAEMPAARLRAEAAEATVKRLRDDLASYGVHLAICQKSRFRDRVMICDCGLDAALTPAGGGDGR